LRVPEWYEEAQRTMEQCEENNSSPRQNPAHKRRIVGVADLVPQVDTRQVCLLPRQGDEAAQAAHIVQF
jgi:hypothetical protein